MSINYFNLLEYQNQNCLNRLNFQDKRILPLSFLMVAQDLIFILPGLREILIRGFLEVVVLVHLVLLNLVSFR